MLVGDGFSRRKLLRSGLVGFGGVVLGLDATASSSKAAESRAGQQAVGIQLYTVRDLMAQNPRQTLADLAALGYAEVEFAGYYDHSPKQIKAMLADLNLTSPSTHVGLSQLTDSLSQTLDVVAEIGHEYVVLAYLSPEQRQGGLETYKRYADLFNEVGAVAKSRGLQFGYHNHAFEFELIDGLKPYDLLLQRVDGDLMAMTMDLYWISKANHDPLAYFQAYPGRFRQCHVKDMDALGQMVDVGAGTIDFAKIFARKAQAGFEHFYVEHDRPVDAMLTAKRSIEHVRTVL